MIKIKDITIGLKGINILHCQVLNPEFKEVIRDGNKLKVCNAILKDETGEIKISAYDFAAEFLANSEIINVKNCMCKTYGGDDKQEDMRQISTGYFGKIEVVKGKI